jgi:hypothetical protein
VLEGLPPGVGRVRLAAGRPQSVQRLGDEIGPDVGHPAQQHEAELASRQSPHAGDPATMQPC